MGAEAMQVYYILQTVCSWPLHKFRNAEANIEINNFGTYCFALLGIHF